MGDLPGDGKGDAVAVSERADPAQVAPSNSKLLSRRQALAFLASVTAAGGVGVIIGLNLAPEPVTQATDPAPSSMPSSTEVAPTDRGRQSRPPLPHPAVSMWINSFEPRTLLKIPSDVINTLTLVVFAMGQSAKSGTGQIRWKPDGQSDEEAAADITALIDQGKPVLLGIGGADDGGITLTNEKQAAQFCDSIRSRVRKFGFTGIDINLEPSGSSWEEASVVSAVRTLKAEFGPDFLVGLTVGLYEEYTSRWLSLARELADECDYWAPMLYDYPEAHDEQLVPDALSKIQIAIDGGVPASKQILGFMCNGYYNTSPVHVTAAVWEAAHTQYPDLRGAYIWESKLERASNYEWTRRVGATVLNG